MASYKQFQRKRVKSDILVTRLIFKLEIVNSYKNSRVNVIARDGIKLSVTEEGLNVSKNTNFTVELAHHLTYISSL